MRLVACAVFFTLLALSGCITRDGAVTREAHPIKPDYRCPGCNVLFISIDTMRADHAGFNGYDKETTPSLDGLAAKSLVYANHYATIPETSPSHASMFTGRLPSQHMLQFNGQTLSRDSHTLAEILSESGYFTGAVTSVYHLNNRSGFEQGFSTFDSVPEISGVLNVSRTADETTSSALSWLAENKGRRFFLWVHYFDPHLPYTPPKEHDVFGSAAYRQSRTVPEDINPDYITQVLFPAMSEYDGEIRFVDAEIGRLVGLLEGEGLLNNTLVVITADHGEAFGEHGYFFDHGDFVYEEQVKVPLVIYDKGLTLKSDRLTQSIQLMPTILEIVGVKNADEMPPSLLSDETLPYLVFESDRCVNPKSGSGCHPVNSTMGKLIAVRDGRYKYILTPIQDGYAQELYDIGSDPFEAVNQSGDGKLGKITEKLRTKAVEVREKIRNASNEAAQADEETIRALRSLGYVV